VSLTADEHTERRQLLLEEEADVVGGDGATEQSGHPSRHLSGVSLAVDALGDEVQDPADLDDPAVGVAQQVGRLLEARAAVGTEELGPEGEPGPRTLSSAGRSSSVGACGPDRP
jgi:hypothetical protein